MFSSLRYTQLSFIDLIKCERNRVKQIDILYPFQYIDGPNSSSFLYSSLHGSVMDLYGGKYIFSLSGLDDLRSGYQVFTVGRNNIIQETVVKNCLRTSREEQDSSPTRFWVQCRCRLFRDYTVSWTHRVCVPGRLEMRRGTHLDLVRCGTFWEPRGGRRFHYQLRMGSRLKLLIS